MRDGLQVRLSEIRELAPGIKEFSFRRVEGGDLPPFSGGSHILLSLPVSGGRSHLNAYSLMGDPDERDVYRVAVKRVEPSRGGSRFLHDNAAVGLSLSISYPVNLFTLVHTGRKHLLVAGGIGVTPILAQARQLARLGADFEVHYAHRSPEQAVFADEFRRLAGAKAHFYADSLGQSIPYAKLFAEQPLGTHLYLCGPEGMLKLAFDTAKALGWPASHLHTEHFLAPQKGAPFKLLLKKSGKELTVDPDSSVLEVVERAGVEAPYLCRGGACGQCETEVLEADGALRHRDVYLTDEEKASGKKLMICVSRLEGKCLSLNL